MNSLRILTFLGVHHSLILSEIFVHISNKFFWNMACSWLLAMHLFALCRLETVFPTVAAAEILSHVLHSLFQASEIIPSKYTMYFLSKLCNNSLVPAVDQTLGHSDHNGPGHFWERWCASGSLWAVVGSQSLSSCGRSLPGAPLVKEGRSGSLCVRKGMG